jgi:hypothetical protein
VKKTDVSLGEPPASRGVIEETIDRWNPVIIALGFSFALILLVFLTFLGAAGLVIAPSGPNNISLQIWGWLILLNFAVFVPAVFLKRLRLLAMIILLLSMFGFWVFQIV